MRLKKLGNRQSACWKALKAMPKTSYTTKLVFKRLAMPEGKGIYLVRTLQGLMDVTEARRLKIPVILSVSTYEPAKHAYYSDLGRYQKAVAGDAMANRKTYAKRFDRLTHNEVKPNPYHTPQEGLENTTQFTSLKY